ncbi:MAG: hypothetical protein WCK76_08890, partial [Elusimicrobiota bacterium]
MNKVSFAGKFILIAALLLGLPPQVPAQTPPGLINFQGRLTDASNNPLSGPHDFIFGIYDASSGGAELWTETQTGITVANGVLAVQLGAVTPITASIFYAPSAYLQITVDTIALSPRQRLVTAPYAFNAYSLQGRDYSAFVSTDSAAQTIAGNKTFTGTLAAPQLRLSGGVDVSSESLASLGAGVRISTNVYIVGFSSAAKYYGDGSSLSGIVGDSLGNHTATQNLNMSGRQIVNVASMTITGRDAGSGYSLFLSSGINMAGGTVNAGLFVGSGAGLYGVLASSVADGKVYTGALEDNAVTSIKIADGAIIAADIALSTISLDRLNQSGCTNNQVPKWNGSAWACGNDDGGAFYTADEASLHLDGGTNKFSALGSSVTLQGNTFNAANKLVRLDGFGYLPALNGSLLTNVSPAQFSAVAADTSTIAGGLTAEITARSSADSALGGRLNTVASDTATLKAQLDVKLSSALASGNIFVGDASSAAVSVTMGGDVTISSTGAAAIGAGKVTNGMLAGSIADGKLSQITAADKVALSALTAGTLANTVVASSVAAGKIYTAALEDGAVTSEKIKDGTMIAADIAESTISLNKLNQSGCTNNQIPKWNGSAWACANDDGGAFYTADEASLHLDGGTNKFSALGSSVTLQGNTFNAANKLVRLDGFGYLPALNGSLLTNVSPAQFSAVAADTSTIAGGLTAEITARSSADSALGGRLNTVAVDTAAISGSLTAEITARSSADGALGGRLNTVASDTTTLKAQLDVKLSSALPTGNIFIGNEAGAAAAAAMGGDVTMSSSGVTAIGTGRVTNDMLAGSIADGKLSQITTADKVAAGAIEGGALPGDVIASSIAVSTVYESALADGAVAPGKVQGGTYAINISGNATTATTATSANNANMATTAGTTTHLAGGGPGTIPYQLAADTTEMLAAGTANYLLQSNGTGAPAWTGAPAISGANITGVPAENIALGNLGDSVVASSVAVGKLYTGALADGAVTGLKIAGGTIGGDNIAVSTISLDKLSQSGCADNQIPKWNGTAWACAADSDSAVVYSADGQTLQLTGTTFSAKGSSVTLQGNSFNAANQLVLLDGGGYLPALDGSLLTNVAPAQFSAVASDTTTLKAQLDVKLSSALAMGSLFIGDEAGAAAAAAMGGDVTMS